MSEILFSVIVPVYNVECYLQQCIDSIFVQIYFNFEVILVSVVYLVVTITQIKCLEKQIRLL